MNTPQFGLKVGSAFFGLVGLAHLVRVATGVKVTVGEFALPLSASVAALVVCGAMAFWLWQLSTQAHPPTHPPATG